MSLVDVSTHDAAACENVLEHMASLGVWMLSAESKSLNLTTKISPASPVQRKKDSVCFSLFDAVAYLFSPRPNSFVRK